MVAMDIKPIRNATDHADALARIEALWDAEPGTEESDTLQVPALLVDEYERVNIPIAPPISSGSSSRS